MLIVKGFKNYLPIDKIEKKKLTVDGQSFVDPTLRPP